VKLESKFNIGDIVFAARADREDVATVCPECLGSRHWDVTSPAGNTMTVECPTCTYGYEVRGYVTKCEVRPTVQQLTIGQVKYETDYDKRDDSMTFKYMCCETGIGSGAIWKEDLLFSSHEAAMERALVLAFDIQKKQDASEEEERKRKLKEFKRHKRCSACGGSGRLSI